MATISSSLIFLAYKEIERERKTVRVGVMCMVHVLYSTIYYMSLLVTREGDILGWRGTGMINVYVTETETKSQTVRGKKQTETVKEYKETDRYTNNPLLNDISNDHHSHAARHTQRLTQTHIKM